MDKLYYFILSMLLVLMALFLYVFLSVDGTEEFVYTNNTVVRVIDGDTFELYSGDVVRLICVDAPEIDEEGGEGSRVFLSDLILGKHVELEKDVSDMDEYGRLLRYVYVNEKFVNREIVQEGYAEVFRYGENINRCDEIEL